MHDKSQFIQRASSGYQRQIQLTYFIVIITEHANHRHIPNKDVRQCGAIYLRRICAVWLGA